MRSGATELFPIIETRDLERALEFYRDLLSRTVQDPGGVRIRVATKPATG